MSFFNVDDSVARRLLSVSIGTATNLRASVYMRKQLNIRAYILPTPSYTGLLLGSVLNSLDVS